MVVYDPEKYVQFGKRKGDIRRVSEQADYVCGMMFNIK